MNKQLKICTIGGGTAMPVVTRSLIRAGFTNIKSIVTTFDNGGDSGRIRTDERGNVLAFSDYWRSLIALWPDEKQRKIWEEMLRYRDGRGRNFGNIFFQFLSEKEGGLGEVDELFEELTGAKLAGEVIPVSLKPSNVCFSTISGKEYRGENFIDDLRMSLDKIEDIWLDPKVEVNSKVKRTLETADLIIVGPGTTFGSVLPNFLPEEMAGAFNKSKARKVFLVNIVATANEVKKANQDDYVDIFAKYLNKENPFDTVVVADLDKLDKKILKKVKYFYELEHAVLVTGNKRSKYNTIVADIATIEDKNMRLRHCEKKLSAWLSKMEF
jgi:uncharacterized cofD-like protein